MNNTQTKTHKHLEQALDLRCAARERLLPETIARVLDELDEGDQQAPRVGAVHDEALQQHARDLLHDERLLGLQENVQKHAAEVVPGGVVERL